MALGLLLQVFLICVLLFSSSTGAPFKPKQQKRPEDASVNLSDDDDDDEDDDDDTDDDDDDAEVNSLPKVVLVPLGNPAIPGSPSPLLNAVSTNIMPVPSFASYPNRNLYYGWSQPGFASVSGDVKQANEGSTAKTGTPHLIYEQVFHYPSRPAGSPPSTYSSSSLVPVNYVQVGEGFRTGNPAAKGPQTIFSWVPGSPYPWKINKGGNFNLGQNGYIPLYKRITWPRRGPVINAQGAAVIQRLRKPFFPVSNYFVQSRSGYRNHRVFASKVSYTPLAAGIFEGVNSPVLS